jgi:hypothetical protein
VPLRCRGQVKLKAFCYSRGFVGGKGCALPIGLQIVSRHLDDATVLRAAFFHHPMARVRTLDEEHQVPLGCLWGGAERAGFRYGRC